MREWYKTIKGRSISYSFLFIFLISSVYALDDCDAVSYIEDIPCLILYRYTGNCSTITVSVYNSSTLLYTETMSNYSVNKCNATLNQTGAGTYSLFYSTGDTGTILVKEGYLRLYVYISLFIIIASLLFIGYYYENPHILFLDGIFFVVLAIDVFFHGFPQVADVFMTNSISIILAGIGMYYLVAPYLVWFKENEGAM